MTADSESSKPQPASVAFWRMEILAVAAQLDSDAGKGLTDDEAHRRLARHGPNQLQEKKGEGPWQIFFGQFNNFIIWVLIAAALVSGALKEWIDTLAILVIVILNAIMGFVQEFRAEKALAALRRMASPNARVFRGGHAQMIPVAELVPGDIVELEAGDHIPADARVIGNSANFAVQEASLTGESAAVMKDKATLPEEHVPLAERRNMVFMGTAVVTGKARALVTGTGMQTELGRIAGMIQAIHRGDTPLQKKLSEFGKYIVWVCFVLVGVVFLLQWLRGGEVLEVFLTAVSLAVAAIPEGLPAVVTIALALGVQRMVRRHVLIRKLPSVETLGCATVICSDKTGTLTRNEMTVREAWAGGQHFTVAGTGYAPRGEWSRDGRTVRVDAGSDLRQVLACGVLCNAARLVVDGESHRILGDPTEGALLTAAAKGGVDRAMLERDYALADELPFDSVRKRMTIIRRAPTGGFIGFVKGAPDVLVQHCTHIMEDGQRRPLRPADIEAILRTNDEMAARALRVLAMAMRPMAQLPDPLNEATMERELTFLGLIAMMDPPRDEARNAIQICHTAGIRAVMITGDHGSTAVAIAKELNLFTAGDEALTGEELDRLTDADLEAKVARIPVYSRVTPEHKLRIVRAWRKRGEVVAMTGDGVNDAPAVKEADIGVAMGITGTDVTKEVSDMIVTDDNFASIVAAVEEGRGIYDNIQKVIHYLLSCNAAEILVMFIASLLGLPAPLLPIQILWVNLVTDGLPALALGVDPIDRNVMKRGPRNPNAGVIGRRRLLLMLGQGCVITVCALAAFAFVYFLENRWSLADFLAALGAWDTQRLGQMFTIPEAQRADLLGRARTVAFIVLAFCQDFHSYNCRNQTESLFKIGLFTNKNLIAATMVSMTLNMLAIYSPFLQGVLKTVPLTLPELLVVIFMASMPLWVMEVYKLIRRRTGSHGRIHDDE